MIETPQIFVLVLLIFLFGLLSRVFRRSVLTPPLAFVALGLALSPELSARLGYGTVYGGLGDLETPLYLLGEITLVVILFVDASQIGLSSLIKDAALPARLLLIGLPVSVVFGALAAWPLFGELGLWELALVAAILAATDAALGQAVVTSERVPLGIRQSLSVESGLNDGIAVVFVLIFASIASIGHGMGGEAMTAVECASFTSKQVLLGPLAGLVVGGAGAWLATRAVRRGWMDHTFEEMVGVALAIIAFVGASMVGGNGFIAAFTAGLVVGNTSKEVCTCMYDFAEAEAQLLMLTTFFLIGIALAWEPLAAASWEVWAYAALSLFLVRTAAVAVATFGLGLEWVTVAFTGWFGPRGLASVLFALLVIDDLPVPHGEEIFQIVLITVLLSVLLHGVTSAPLASLYGRVVDAQCDEDALERASLPADLISKKLLTTVREGESGTTTER